MFSSLAKESIQMSPRNTDSAQASVDLRSIRVGMVTGLISRAGAGVFHAVRRLSQCIQEVGPEVTVFGFRDDRIDEDLPLWQPIKPVVSPVVGPLRLGWSPAMGRELASFDPSHALLHQHGLWQYPSLAVLRWGRKTHQPTVISPHGMLDPWAVRNSAWRKRIVGWAYEYQNLRSAKCLHALADSEYQSMRAFGLRNPVAIIPNGVDIPHESELTSDPPASIPSDWQGQRLLLFLSRIHPKKGIMPLLEAWSRLGKQKQNWRLAIIGPDEVGHRAEVEGCIQSKNLGREVAVFGPQYGAEKRAWLCRADAFVLPSFSEGFPIAVLEAMAYRLPVLMTDECNFPEAFEAGMALRARPESESLQAGLVELLSMSPDEARVLGSRVREFVRANYAWPTIALRMAEVYQWLLGGGSAPVSVRTI